MVSYLEQSMAKIKEFEGSVPWMYLDTVGKVTVGVGLMLASEAAAHALPFTMAGQSASAEQIAREFTRVSGMKKGQLAKFYFSKQGLELPVEAIDQKLRESLLGMEGYLRSQIRGYQAIPDGGKLALLDMIYNLGPGRLFSEYPHLIAAVERGDWKSAAAASARKGPGASRNAWVKQQFLDALSVVALKAEAAEAAAGPVLLGLVTGLAAIAAAVILSGTLGRFAARIRSRRYSANVL